MEIHVSGRSGLAAQIYRQVRAAVLEGRLRPGEQVPATRELAAQLGISRTTVGVAYDRLTAEGFLVGRVGAGTYVSDAPLPAPASARPGPPLPVAVPADSGGPGGAPRAGWDFRVGMPDPDLFPLATWRRLMSAALRAAVFRDDAYGDPAGVPALRAAIAHHVGVARAVRAHTDDVLVTAGAQQAFDLIGRVLLAPGDRVAIEAPGYPAARALYAARGARIVDVPVDAEGLVVDALPRDVRLVYVTPAHQYPLGVPLSLTRRAALLRWADHHDAIVVEDDYDSEFRYADRPLEPLQSLDPDGRVVYVGSFAKTLSPALRLGFLVAPRSLRPALVAARRLADRHGDPVTQHALARFLDEGRLARHVRRATRVYAARHQALTVRLDRDFADVLTRIPSAAGLHLSVRAAPGVDVARLARGAARRGVHLETLPEHGGLVFGFGLVPAEKIPSGLDALRDAVDRGHE
ncbi:PLP-dependent aminotransferase family protein [Cryptosporangium arvum]|uniref:MocR-like pyridoxine biosynthesis transcription factor PdxR n=1 Tax=Cryptosporangium arvum TaxID=80871 RepID=UPI0004B264FE|nr:PLP-dependent aminotransferase family protein [Cryptosporangium arvum]